MVFLICPQCGEGMDGQPNMEDPAAWYAKHHPDLPVDSAIPSICRDCDYDYGVGESVVARDRQDATVYTISSIIRRENQPPLLTVTAPDGRTRHFAVTQIRPVRAKVPGPANPSTKPDDRYF